MNCVSETQTPDGISQEPINILFSPSSVVKKDVWDIDLIKILDLLLKILEKSGRKDLKVAGMAALSSSLIYRMKVESIFALQKAAMEKKPMYQRTDVDIELIDFPYRHESTYPVSLDDLLGLLQNLIGTIANPQSRRNGRLEIEPIEAPDFNEYFISLESIIGKYEDLVMKKIGPTGFGLLQEIISELDQIDSIRCFFAILFLARDQKVDLEQVEDDIKIIAIKETTNWSKMARIENLDEATARIESALYSAGRPLRIEDLIRASGTESRTKTLELLNTIMKKTKTAFKALEVTILPDGSYVMQLKPEYSSTVKRYASKPILPNATLKTLSYIAYQQPISSKQLVETRGSGVYSHLKELRQLDFIGHQNVGRLKIYTTTQKFQKYFGIQGDVEDLKSRLFSKVRKTASMSQTNPTPQIITETN